jgi:ABC-2 type transport system permease protein
MSTPATTSTATPSRLPDLRLGLLRGWITFRSLVLSGEGFVQYVLWTAVPLVVLVLNRGSTIPGTDISITASLLPSLLALMLAFGVMGTAYALSNEREDGTLLRAKAVPGGMSSYVAGLCTASALDGLLSLTLLLVPAMFLVPGVPFGSALLWLGLLGYVLLGLAAVLPLGIAVGSVMSNPRVIGGLGMMATSGLAAISGLFFPIQVLWGWVQAFVQVLPVYWLGLGLRSVFLPAEAAAVEVGGSWRTFETIGVLVAWAVVGLVLGPVLLRRMARRESGSAVEARRQRALQRT